MSITLSSADLRRLESITRLLARPLDAPDADGWRAQVLAELKVLLGADTAGFHLPVEDGVEFYTDDFSLSELESRPYLPPPALPDGSCIVKRSMDLGVGTLEGAYGRDGALYRHSDYYNEYARPLGKNDTLFTFAGWGDLTEASVASLQFHRGSAPGGRFGEREVAILRLVYPAFAAGIDAWRRWNRWRSDLLRMLDSTRQAALVFACDGRLLHRTPALADLLAQEPIGDSLVGQMREAARALTGPSSGEVPAVPASREVKGVSGRYAMNVCTYDGGTGALLAVASIERLTPIVRRADDLRASYGLTPAEARVATLLASGRANADIARELTISPHTARRHTERVMRKLGVHARAEVAARVLT